MPGTVKDPDLAASGGVLKRSRVLALAWPIILAQVATATTGIVDTAVIFRFGTAVDLAAGVVLIALGVVVLGRAMLGGVGTRTPDAAPEYRGAREYSWRLGRVARPGYPAIRSIGRS